MKCPGQGRAKGDAAASTAAPRLLRIVTEASTDECWALRMHACFVFKRRCRSPAARVTCSHALHCQRCASAARHAAALHSSLMWRGIASGAASATASAARRSAGATASSAASE